MIDAYLVEGRRFIDDEIRLWIGWRTECIKLMMCLMMVGDGLGMVVGIVLISSFEVGIKIHDCYYY